MPTHLPIPLAYFPRTEQDLATAGERLASEVSLHVGPLVEKTVVVNGAPVTKKSPSFVEWWLEYPAEFVVAGSAPPAPADDRVRELLATTARIAANAWAKEFKTAKGWPPEPPPLFAPNTNAPPLPFAPATDRKGSK